MTEAVLVAGSKIENPRRKAMSRPRKNELNRQMKVLFVAWEVTLAMKGPGE